MDDMMKKAWEILEMKKQTQLHVLEWLMLLL